jgi:hypothetical protein
MELSSAYLSRIYEELFNARTIEQLNICSVKVEALNSTYPNKPEILFLKKLIKTAITSERTMKSIAVLYILISVLLLLIQRDRRRPRQRPLRTQFLLQRWLNFGVRDLQSCGVY